MAVAVDPILAWLVATVVLVGLAAGVMRLATALRRDLLEVLDLPGRADAFEARLTATAEVAEVVSATSAVAAALVDRLDPPAGPGGDRTIPPG